MLFFLVIYSDVPVFVLVFLEEETQNADSLFVEAQHRFRSDADDWGYHRLTSISTMSSASGRNEYPVRDTEEDAVDFTAFLRVMRNATGLLWRIIDSEYVFSSPSFSYLMYVSPFWSVLQL